MSLEDYQALCARLGLGQDIPYTPQWSAAADFLELLVEHVLTARPATLVECGSGLTTLMLARCCAINGRGHVYSLENGADYAAASRAALARNGLERHATVIHAPLERYTLAGREYQWYALERLTVRDIDLLVIDGPPGFLQRHSRYPALPLLRERLAAGGTVFLDDAARPDERELVAWWQAEWPALRHDFIANQRGCSVLRIPAA